MAMRDSDWKNLFRLLRQVLQLPGDRDEQRQAVEEAIDKLGIKDGPETYDQFCALNLDGADQVLDDEEYEQMMESRHAEVYQKQKVLKLRTFNDRQEANGHGPSLLD